MHNEAAKSLIFGTRKIFSRSGTCWGQFAVLCPSVPPLCGSRDFATMCTSQFVRCLCVGGKFVL